MAASGTARIRHISLVCTPFSGRFTVLVVVLLICLVKRKPVQIRPASLLHFLAHVRLVAVEFNRPQRGVHPLGYNVNRDTLVPHPGYHAGPDLVRAPRGRAAANLVVVDVLAGLRLLPVGALRMEARNYRVVHPRADCVWGLAAPTRWWTAAAGQRRRPGRPGCVQCSRRGRHTPGHSIRLRALHSRPRPVPERDKLVVRVVVPEVESKYGAGPGPSVPDKLQESVLAGVSVGGVPVVLEEPLRVLGLKLGLVDLLLARDARRVDLLRERLVNEFDPRTVLEEILDRSEFVVQADGLNVLAPPVGFAGLEIPSGEIIYNIEALLASLEKVLQPVLIARDCGLAFVDAELIEPALLNLTRAQVGTRSPPSLVDAMRMR